MLNIGGELATLHEAPKPRVKRMLKEKPTPWHAELRAIAFDVQGTCVDFYQPVLRAGAAINRSKGLAIDWAELSAEWRDLYRATLDEVIDGKRPWMRVDQIYREALDVLLNRRWGSMIRTSMCACRS